MIPDNPAQLKNHIINLVNNFSPHFIITTGGTGLSSQDITTSVIQELCDRIIPGIGELLRYSGAKHTKYSYLSTAVAGILNDTLIICLPGNPKAISESMDVLIEIIPHAVYTASKEEIL